MAAKNGPPRLRRLMGRARGRDESAARRGDAADIWPRGHFGPGLDSGLYAEYADPHAEAEREFMTEAREILGIDEEPGGSGGWP